MINGKQHHAFFSTGDNMKKFLNAIWEALISIGEARREAYLKNPYKHWY
jgi:hypothetical protein